MLSRERGLDFVGLYERGDTADQRFISPHRRKQMSLSVWSLFASHFHCLLWFPPKSGGLQAECVCDWAANGSEHGGVAIWRCWPTLYPLYCENNYASACICFYIYSFPWAECTRSVAMLNIPSCASNMGCSQVWRGCKRLNILLSLVSRLPRHFFQPTVFYVTEHGKGTEMVLGNLFHIWKSVSSSYCFLFVQF